jgi:pimeloyl-ACP methyl ester carboxylesterase
MGPVERCTAVADGVRLHLLHWQPSEQRAAPPAFLLVHGLASNARLWDGVAAELAAAGHEAIAVDLRGHGRSDKPDSGYDVGSVTDDLLTLISAEGLDRPVVAGQSWGGNLVVELAWKAPDRLRGVCAVDGGFIELARRFPDWDECARALRPPVLTGMRATRLEGMLRAAHPSWPETAIQGTMANFEVGPDGTIAPRLTLERHLLVLRGLWEHHPSTRFPEIEVPVMFAPADTGTDAEWTADKRAAIAAAEAALRRCRTHWFAPADHDLHAQHPHRLAAHLLAAVADGFWS